MDEGDDVDVDDVNVYLRIGDDDHVLFMLIAEQLSHGEIVLQSSSSNST